MSLLDDAHNVMRVQRHCLSTERANLVAFPFVHHVTELTQFRCFGFLDRSMLADTLNLRRSDTRSNLE